MKTTILVILMIITFIAGTVVTALGYDMLTAEDNKWDWISSSIVSLAGIVILFISYLIGFTIYCNHKNKLNEFFLNEQ